MRVCWEKQRASELPGFGGSASQLLGHHPSGWLFPEGSAASFFLEQRECCPRAGKSALGQSPGRDGVSGPSEQWRGFQKEAGGLIDLF